MGIFSKKPKMDENFFTVLLVKLIEDSYASILAALRSQWGQFMNNEVFDALSKEIHFALFSGGVVIANVLMIKDKNYNQILQDCITYKEMKYFTEQNYNEQQVDNLINELKNGLNKYSDLFKELNISEKEDLVIALDDGIQKLSDETSKNIEPLISQLQEEQKQEVLTVTKGAIKMGMNSVLKNILNVLK